MLKADRKRAEVRANRKLDEELGTSGIVHVDEEALKQHSVVVYWKDLALVALPKSKEKNELWDWAEHNHKDALVSKPDGLNVDEDFEVVALEQGAGKEIVELIPERARAGRVRIMPDEDYADADYVLEQIAHALHLKRKAQRLEEERAERLLAKKEAAGSAVSETLPKPDTTQIASIIEANGGVIVRRHGKAGVYFSDEMKAVSAGGGLNKLLPEQCDIKTQEAGEHPIYRLNMPEGVSLQLAGADAQLNGTVVLNAEGNQTMKQVAEAHFLQNEKLQPAANNAANNKEQAHANNGVQKHAEGDRFSSMDECTAAIMAHGVLTKLLGHNQPPQIRLCFIDEKLAYKVYRYLLTAEREQNGEYLLGRTFTHKVRPVEVHAFKPNHEIPQLDGQQSHELPSKPEVSVDVHEGEIRMFTLPLYPRMSRYLEEKGVKKRDTDAIKKEESGETAWLRLFNRAIDWFPVDDVKEAQAETASRRKELEELRNTSKASWSSRERRPSIIVDDIEFNPHNMALGLRRNKWD